MRFLFRTLTGWLLLLVVTVVSPAQVSQDSGLRVRVSIYEVPSLIVSMMRSWPDPRGGVSSITQGGDQTESFPEGVVLLQDRIPGSFTDSDVIQEIGKFMATPCIVPQMIFAGFLACHEFEFSEPLESREQSGEIKARGVDYRYRLRVTSGEQSGDKLPVRVQLWMNRNDPRQFHFPWEDNVERQILDCSVAVAFPGSNGENGAAPRPEPLESMPAQIAERPARGVLIGIAAHDNFGEPRRTVYWLAISADKRGGYFLSGK